MSVCKITKMPEIPQFKGSLFNKILLTFDDGPSNVTSQVLDLLLQYNVHATFFVLVDNALKFPDLIKREIREGHEVALHGLNHRSWRKMDRKSTKRDLTTALNLLKDQFQVVPKHYRPAYGTITPHNFDFAIKNNMKITLWDVMTTDWKGRLRGKAGTILDATRDKSAILCMHDGYRSKIHSGSTLEILKIILPVLKSTHDFELLK